MKLFNKRLAFVIILFSFIFVLPVLAQVSEVEIFNEWFLEDCPCSFERPFFLIRNYEDFNIFWQKIKLGNAAPYYDFNKYMVFVWAPGYTRKNCSKVNFERLLFKEGNLLLLVDFDDSSKFFGQLRRPVKIAVFQKVKDSDLFVFRKIQIGWKSYDYKLVYKVWNMEFERKRPLEITLMDREIAPKYALATFSGTLEESDDNEVPEEQTTQVAVQPKEESKSKVEPVRIVTAPKQTSSARQPTTVQTPRALPEPISPKMQTAVQPQTPRNTSPNQTTTTSQPPKTTGVVSTSPIVIGGTPAPTVKPDSKSEVAPGMGEDPLFGAEFDITF